MANKNYTSVAVKNSTYKTLKQLALDAGLPFTKLLDKMIEVYKASL